MFFSFDIVNIFLITNGTLKYDDVVGYYLYTTSIWLQIVTAANMVSLYE